MTELDAARIHARALLLLDELHRIGFEQLRFSRSAETTWIRLEIYAASSATGQDWSFAGEGPMLRFSYHLLSANFRSPHLSEWPRLLAGDLKPRHLAGRFVLDFPELVRPAYAADHQYREWFRGLRPLIQQGYLPMTCEEDPYGTQPDFNRYVVMYSSEDKRMMPRPPDNPFVPVSDGSQRP